MMPKVEPDQVLSITEITRQLRAVLEESFESVWVRGEISNFATPPSGHLYFTLKDAGAQLRAVCFRGVHGRLRVSPRNGLEVLAHGRITVYEPRGEYQIIIDEMLEGGLGRLQLAFEQLKEKLKQEGLFDPARKRKIPLLPARVGVVTSPTGAAIRDILQILRRRNSTVKVLIYPVKVQGEGAAAEIAEGIRYFSSSGGVDVIIAGRGGGSIEDLWSFNEEVTARAIYESQIPVISAVGHEIDFTIADFVADVRAPTPSAAAEMVAAAAEELAFRLEGLRKTLITSWTAHLAQWFHQLEILTLKEGFAGFRHRLTNVTQQVDELALRLPFYLKSDLAERQKNIAGLRQRLALANPENRLRESSHRLATLTQAMAAGIANFLTKKGTTTALLTEKLTSLSPRAVLERGYSLCLDGEGRVVKTYRQAEPGVNVSVILAEGVLGCRVETSGSSTHSGDSDEKRPTEKL